MSGGVVVVGELGGLRPLLDRVVVRLVGEVVEQVSAGGIVLPESVAESRLSQKGVVVRVGGSCCLVGVGDFVVFPRWGGSPFVWRVGGEDVEFVILSERDIQCVVDEGGE